MARFLVVLCVAVESNGWLIFLHSTVGLLFDSWLSRGHVVRRRTLLRIGLLSFTGHFCYVLLIITDQL